MARVLLHLPDELVARPPLVVPVPSAGPRSVAVCDQVRAVDERRLAGGEGALVAANLRAVEGGLNVVLGL